jgi:hypothetical protein
MTMAESILRDKSKEFAKQIVFLCRDIKANMKGPVLTNQLLRSGTSIGANIHEAQYAQGTRILYQNWRLRKKSATKRNIGWNCSLKRVISPKMFISLYKINADKFVEC